MMSRLANQWVLITGASSGIGAAAAHLFAIAGANLLLGARRIDRIREVAREAERAGAPYAQSHPLDVASTASVEGFAQWARSQAPRVDVLVNNAGGAHGLDHVVNGKDSDWETMMQTNVLGILRMSRAIIPLMPHDAGSTIINIGSTAGHTAYEGGAAYCAAKAGERQITAALRLELCGTGIRVGSVDPGLAETEFSLVRFKGDQERASAVYEGMQPLRATDIAEAIAWVASRPAHVNIDQMLIKPVAQAALHKIHRRIPS